MTQRPLWYQRVSILLCLAGGILTTAYGFYTLIGYQDDHLVWRYGARFPLIFVGLMLLIAVAGLWRGPDPATLLITSLAIVLLGNIVPAAVVCLQALSMLLLGRLILRGKEGDGGESLLVGTVIYGTVLSLFAPFPVNNRATWSLVFIAPLIFWWRSGSLRLPWPCRADVEPLGHTYLLKCAIGALIVIHTLVSMMPEVGHDALSMHLFVPTQVAHRQLWEYNVSLYSWAVMPKLVNWLYTAAYMLGGETAARFMNLGAVLFVGFHVRRLSRWAGADEVGSNWGLLLFLVTPLTYLETSSLFIEGMWTALVLGGTSALLRLVTSSLSRRRELLVAAILFGGAMSAKAVTSTHLPILALLLLTAWRRWYTPDLARTTVVAVLIFSLLALLPYITAYSLTGNPVFPFFNAYFKSPLYPAENFEPPAMFDRGFRFGTLYDMTFHSGRFLEGTAGASGFQWLLLIVPGVVALVVFRRWRVLLVTSICLGWLALTFWQTANLRYVFPSFALSGLVIAVTVSLCRGLGRPIWRFSLGVVLLTLILNLIHFSAATWHGYINPVVMLNERSRDAYLSSLVPIRLIVRRVNELNHENAPVLFFSPPLTAGLKADALYVDWYNPRLRDIVRAASTPDDFERIFLQERVRFIVIEEGFKTTPLMASMKLLCSEVVTINNTTLYEYRRSGHSK